MADEVKTSRAAGWKVDPSGRFAGRYWNGTGWTEHVVDQDRATSVDPLPSLPGQAAGRTGSGSPVVEALRRTPQWAKIAALVAVIALIAFVITSGGDDPPLATGVPPAETVAPAAAPAPAVKSVYAIGETARTGDFDVIVHGFKDPQPPGQFLQPAQGMHFVTVDVELVNRSSRQRSFSSLLGFRMVDGADRQFDSTFSDITPPAPDGDFPPGQTLRGLALFEVPDGTSGLRFRAHAILGEAGVLFALR